MIYYHFMLNLYIFELVHLCQSQLAVTNFFLLVVCSGHGCLSPIEQYIVSVCCGMLEIRTLPCLIEICSQYVESVY